MKSLISTKMIEGKQAHSHHLISAGLKDRFKLVPVGAFPASELSQDFRREDILPKSDCLRQKFFRNVRMALDQEFLDFLTSDSVGTCARVKDDIIRVVSVQYRVVVTLIVSLDILAERLDRIHPLSSSCNPPKMT